MKMFYKKDNTFVEVYHFFTKDSKPMALIFSPIMAQGRQGNGWIEVRPSQLIPEEYYNHFSVKNFMSKAERKEIKKRLSSTSTVWTCSDNVSFSNIEDAIIHEKKIVEKEEKLCVSGTRI